MVQTAAATPRSEISPAKLNAAGTEQQSNSFHDTMVELSSTQTALWYVFGPMCVRVCRCALWFAADA